MRAIADAQHKHFKWGSHDCCMFAAKCVEDMTGVNLARDFNGYHNKEGAEEKLDGQTLEQIMDEMDLRKVKAWLALRGDVVLADVIQGEALGICTGTHVTFTTARGTVNVQLALCRVAWHIPF